MTTTTGRVPHLDTNGQFLDRFAPPSVAATLRSPLTGLPLRLRQPRQLQDQQARPPLRHWQLQVAPQMLVDRPPVPGRLPRLRVVGLPHRPAVPRHPVPAPPPRQDRQASPVSTGPLWRLSGLILRSALTTYSRTRPRLQAFVRLPRLYGRLLCSTLGRAHSGKPQQRRRSHLLETPPTTLRRQVAGCTRR